MRLMAPDQTKERFLWFVIGLLLVVNTVQNIVTYTHCRPVQDLWRLASSGQCRLDAGLVSDLGYIQGGMSL